MRSVLRILHPIGQGSFYSEHFCVGAEQNGRMNVVYDCGSIKGSKCLKAAIYNTFRDGEEIEAVFISHLHSDHMNGIPDLINRCSVKRIFFPLITEQNKILAKIRLIAEGVDSEFCFRFIDSPEKAIKVELGDKARDIKLIGVFPYENKETDVFESDLIPSLGKEIEGVCDATIQSGMRITSKMIGLRYPEWIYVPYNFEFNSKNNILIRTLKRVGITEKKLTKLGENPEEYGREIALIKELYKEVGNDFNSHSMTLYSGRITGALGNSFSYRLSDYEYLSECGTCPSVDKIWFTKSLCTPFNPWVPNTNKRCQPPIAEGKYGGRSGCLYTGDYNMSEEKTVDELCEQYSLYWNTLLAMQVPHHGSKLSYNRKLVKEGVIYFISAARKNNFNHPSFQVVNNISLMGGHPIIVTEDFESNVCFETMFPDCFFVKENQNRKETEDNQIGVIIIQTPPSIEYRYGQS